MFSFAGYLVRLAPDKSDCYSAEFDCVDSFVLIRSC